MGLFSAFSSDSSLFSSSISLDGVANSLGDGLNKGVEFLNDPVNSFKNLTSPDGVQSTFERKVATSGKTLNALSAYAHIDINNVSGISPSVLQENTPINGGSIFYQQIEESEVFKTDSGESKLGPRPYSVFNKFSLINYQGSPLFPETPGESKSYNKTSPSAIKNPTATQIIEITSAIPENYGYRYDYSDFALAKYFGRIPNNQMITLRRFAFPSPDDIITPKGPDGESLPQPDLARAVTWLGEATGNSMAEILKFSTGFGWKDAEAGVQEMRSENKARSGAFGNIVESSAFLRNFAAAGRGMNAVDLANSRANAGYDAFRNTYPNHTFGPLNVIKKVLVREPGLEFNQEFTLKFEYELRELGGANPKILMLDQLSNLLVLTYNNAPFWGGSTRWIGDGSVARPLGNIEHIRNGDYKSFLGSVVSDLGKAAGGSLTEIIGNAGKALSGILGGSFMELFNSPQGGQAINSLLTGDPTGQWHVTIGNPLNPIMVIGNLACTGTDISFEGNIGPEDFPEKLVVTVKLKPGRPRDKADIESMFNAGRGRFYLSPKDGVDTNKTLDVSAYGNKDRKANQYVNTFNKLANG